MKHNKHTNIASSPRNGWRATSQYLKPLPHLPSLRAWPRIQVVNEENNLHERLDPGSMSGMTTKRAFTLIELLVVVLVIGILSAIALPQYEKAVRKARIAEARMNLRALSDATDRYILENGGPQGIANDFSNLDISIPMEKNWSYYSEDFTARGMMIGAIPKFESGYTIFYASVNYGDEDFAGNFACYSDTENGIKVCAGLGKEVENADGWFLMD